MNVHGNHPFSTLPFSDIETAPAAVVVEIVRSLRPGTQFRRVSLPQRYALARRVDVPNMAALGSAGRCVIRIRQVVPRITAARIARKVEQPAAAVTDRLTPILRAPGRAIPPVAQPFMPEHQPAEPYTQPQRGPVRSAPVGRAAWRAPQPEIAKGLETPLESRPVPVFAYSSRFVREPEKAKIVIVDVGHPATEPYTEQRRPLLAGRGWPLRLMRATNAIRRIVEQPAAVTDRGARMLTAAFHRPRMDYRGMRS